MTWTMTWRLLIIALTCMGLGVVLQRTGEEDLGGISGTVFGFGVFICLLLTVYWLATWVLS